MKTQGFGPKLVLILTTALCIASLQAAPVTWDGSTDGNWNTGGNWGGTPPANGDDITFDATSVGVVATTNDIVGLSLTKITLSNPPATVSVSGNAFTLTGAGGVGIDLNTAGNLTVSPTITLGGALSFTVAAGQTLTVGGITQAGNLLTLNGAGDHNLTGLITGAGGITAAAGTTTISGNNNNNFSGAVNVSNGATLVISDANALGGTAAGTTVASGGTLTLQGGITTAAEALTISGTGVGGNGALRNLSGANTYAGAITLAAASTITSTAGTLSLTNTIDNGGFTATFAGAGNTTASGVISGTGGLTKSGAGTLILSGANTYTGDTTLNGGTTVINAANGIGVQSVLSATAINVTDNSTLQLGGSFTLGSNAGVTIANTKTLTLDSNGNNLTISGIIAGAGGLTKAGTGTLTLNGIDTFSGTTTINAGTVVFGANHTGGGAITLGASGTMYAGSRTLTTSALTVNGNFTPGSASTPGNATISGNLSGSGTFNARFQSDTVFDKLTISGAGATANVGSMTLTPVFSYSPNLGTQYTIVDLTGGGGAAVSGTFTLNTASLNPTLQISLTYNAASIVLVIQNNLANPALNLTPTQQGVATSLATGAPSSDLTIVQAAIGTLTTSDAVKAAYDEITPAKLNDLAEMTLSAVQEQNSNLDSRMNALRAGGADSFSFTDDRSASWSFDGTLLADNNQGLSSLRHAKVVPKSEESPWGIFALGSGIFGEQDSTPGRTGYEFTSAGATVGADYQFNSQIAAGFALGYNRTDTTLDRAGGTAKVDTITAGPYANFHAGDDQTDFYINGALTYGHSLFDTKRHIVFASIDRTAEGDPSGNMASALFSTGYDIKQSHFIFGPTASIQYTRQWIDSYAEKNAGALNLTIDDQTVESIESQVGGRVAYEWEIRKVTVVPSLFASYQHEFSDDARNITAKLGGGSSFQTTTSSPHRDFANVGCGVNVKLSEAISFAMGCSTLLGDRHYNELSVSGSLRYRF